MDYIRADDDGRILTICEKGHGLGVGDGVDTAELGIDPRNRCEINQNQSNRNLLQADIRVVLRLRPEAFAALEALGRYTDLAIRETKPYMDQ